MPLIHGQLLEIEWDALQSETSAAETYLETWKSEALWALLDCLTISNREKTYSRTRVRHDAVSVLQ